jgi:hypothetical protein
MKRQQVLIVNIQELPSDLRGFITSSLAIR